MKTIAVQGAVGMLPAHDATRFVTGQTKSPAFIETVISSEKLIFGKPAHCKLTDKDA